MLTQSQHSIVTLPSSPPANAVSMVTGCQVALVTSFIYSVRKMVTGVVEGNELTVNPGIVGTEAAESGEA